MCQYTFFHYECGDAAEDHVDAKGCSEFKRTGVHCDRDNPANKDRVKILRNTRNGDCGKCRQISQNAAEIAAMERELEKAKEQSRLEAKQREEQMRRAEEKMRKESLADYERKKAALAAETAELERMSKELYDQKMRQEEQRQLALTLKKSADEALSRQKEEEELQRALKESMRITHSPTNQDIVSTKRNYRDGSPTTSQDALSGNTNTSKSAPPPPPPPMPTRKTSILSPPPMPTSPTSKPVQARRTVSAPKPAEPVRDWSLPLVGEQEYGHLKIGNRSQPIHPSQKVTPPSKPAQMSPTGPSPEARLRGVIAPDLPTLRQVQGQVPSTHAPRPGFTRPAGTRRVSEPPVDPSMDPKLQAILAKRRQWEPVEEDNTSNLSIRPSESASSFSSPSSTPTSSELSKSAVRADSPQDMMRDISKDVEDGALQARRLNRVDFDTQRKAGWKQE